MPVPSDALLKSLREMRCLVISPASKRRDAMCDQLRRCVGAVEVVWPAPWDIAPGVNIVIASIADLPTDSALYRMERKARCVIALVDEESPASLKGMIDLGAHAVLHRPAQPMAVVMALALGVSISSYENRLRTKLGKLENNLRTAHTVERAVKVLATSLKLSEEQAYQHLRSKAMERREPMNELALQVIKAHAILDDMGAGRENENAAAKPLRVVSSSGTRDSSES
jgi:AmiR/NasT family two-component response regulator